MTSPAPTLLDRVDLLPVAPGGPGGTDPRETVAALAVDGCLLGFLAEVHPPDDGWWGRALHAVAAYAGLPAPHQCASNLDLDLEAEPFRDPSPLTDAVLRLVREGGTEALTLDRVAAESGRDPDWILSMHGSVQELVDALVGRIAEQAFEDLLPAHDEPELPELLAACASSERVVAMVRFLALTGVEVAPGVVEATRETSPVTRGDDLTDRALVAALALDGWALGSAARRYPWPEAVTADVAAELRALAA
jgi:hypothetical protein